MKPLIKWAGGKSSEVKYVKNIIPKFDRYIEPFFGGGALFFKLEPKKAIINDVSNELITFYKLLKNGKSGQRFKTELYNYVHHWERIDVYMKEFGNDFLELYKKYRENKIDYERLKKEIEVLFKKKVVPFNGLFKKEFCVNRQGLLKEIENKLLAKLKRTKEKIDIKKRFNDVEIKMNIETGFRSGFYIHFRNIMNETNMRLTKISKEKKIANWYFIREFCYGGMFRFNREGDFNVPYGGIAYNTKDFRKKVDYIFSDKVRSILTRTKTKNKDFEKLLKSLELTKKDFVFLDPPYDTEFSEYEENPFTKEDQKRLAKTLINLKAKWILIIKETDFIKGLYENKQNIKMGIFDKSYTFNIKDRMNTEVKHLIIHNLDISEEKQIKLFALL
ncbi:DNA adenine methylase [Candidatus Pacearchaeota archaeon]|nr:DNA adenine methylase [Candidatus Pacearchaeota archaeon]